jgi:hypothetical protein
MEKKLNDLTSEYLSILSQDEEAANKYILSRYEKSINYYWKSSRSNKKYYKFSRILTIVLGALVTLVASLSSAGFVTAIKWLDVVFSIATPVLAAILAIVGGFAQSFHWGATWRDMVINAERLEKERDLFLVTKPEERDIRKQLETLNELVINESKSFFQRVLESIVTSKKTDNTVEPD